LHLQTKFRKDRSNQRIYRDFCDFSRALPPPSWIFKKIKILTVNLVPVANVRHRAKFRQDRSNGRRHNYGDLTAFFKMAAVRHFGFVGRLLGPPTMIIWWSISLSQIWLKSMQ